MSATADSARSILLSNNLIVSRVYYACNVTDAERGERKEEGGKGREGEGGRERESKGGRGSRREGERLF